MPLLRVHQPESRPTEQTDWRATREAIVAGLDLTAEFEALGVRWKDGVTKSGGVRECYAMGRAPGDEDDVASAACNVRTGFYWDSGGSQEKLPFLDFAAKYGNFGSWYETAKHYAQKADVEIGKVSRNGRGDILERIYEYQDAVGALRYGTFRYKKPNGKKDFKQYPIRNGTWLKEEGAMDGVDPLPYRLPQLLAAADDEPVLVVAGEQDVERAESIGMVATSNHGGEKAHARTWEKFKDLLPRRDYYLIPDNDEAGRKHVLAVAAILYPLARSVRIVPLSDGPKGTDLSDWLAMGHDIFELGRLMHAAPVWTPEAPDPFAGAAPAADPDRPCRLATAADLIRMGQTTEWIWEGWLPKAVLVLLAAEANTGKTRLCMDINRRINLGLPWPDGAENAVPAGSRCLWVVADGQHSQLADTSINYGFDPWSVVLNTDPDDIFGGNELGHVDQLDRLERNIAEVKPVLVFIDTITNTSDHKSQDTVDAKRQYKPLMEIAQRTGTTIVCVTHLNARGKVIGRRANEKTRVTIAMSQPDPDDARLRLEVTHTRLTTPPPPLGVAMSLEGSTYDPHPPVAPDPEDGDGPPRAAKGARVKAAMAWLREHLAAGPRRSRDVREAAAEAKIIPDSSSAQTLYSALRKLGGTEGEIAGTYGKWFRLPADDDGLPVHRNGDA